MNQRDQSKGKAVALLSHYLTLTMEKAGLKPDSDTHAEIEEIVDHIIDAAVHATMEEMKKQIMTHSTPRLWPTNRL